MAAKKSAAKVEDVGTPADTGEGGRSVQQYFVEQDQTPGSRRNPLKVLPSGGVADLVTPVQACRTINGIAGKLMFDPAALYRDCGNTAPSAYELEPGQIRFSLSECEAFAKAWQSRKAEDARLKAEEEEWKAENARFLAEKEAEARSARLAGQVVDLPPGPDQDYAA